MKVWRMPDWTSTVMKRAVDVGMICLDTVSACVSAAGEGSAAVVAVTGDAKDDGSVDNDVEVGFGSSWDDNGDSVAASVAATAVVVGSPIGTLATTGSDVDAGAVVVVFSIVASDDYEQLDYSCRFCRSKEATTSDGQRRWREDDDEEEKKGLVKVSVS